MVCAIVPDTPFHPTHCPNPQSSLTLSVVPSRALVMFVRSRHSDCQRARVPGPLRNPKANGPTEPRIWAQVSKLVHELGWGANPVWEAAAQDGAV